MDRIWKKIYNDDGTLIYEGFTLDNKAYGAGVSYYEKKCLCGQTLKD